MSMLASQQMSSPPRQIYPRPPIVEAVISFRFATSISGHDLSEALSSLLASQYPAPPKQKRNIAIEIGSDPLDASARSLSPTIFLRSADGLRLVGCSDNSLSVHVLAPYPGWERFIEQAHEAVNALPDNIRTGGVSMVGIRYIDRITLPTADSAFRDFLQITPITPIGMPSTIAGFHCSLQSADPDDGTIILLTIANTIVAESNLPAIVYDLALQRNYGTSLDLHGTSWATDIDILHIKLRDIFEASITDRTRELFK